MAYSELLLEVGRIGGGVRERSNQEEGVMGRGGRGSGGQKVS